MPRNEIEMPEKERDEERNEMEKRSMHSKTETKWRRWKGKNKLKIQLETLHQSARCSSYCARGKNERQLWCLRSMCVCVFALCVRPSDECITFTEKKLIKSRQRSMQPNGNWHETWPDVSLATRARVLCGFGVPRFARCTIANFVCCRIFNFICVRKS